MTDLSVGLPLLTVVLAPAAGTLGGVVGFGSAVILLPLCNIFFGARAAVPVLTIAALRVPIMVVPTGFNYLLNPRRRDFPRIAIGTPLRFPFDPRLP